MFDDDKSVNEAINAYQLGDYKNALKKFKKLAFWDNGLAYYFLGQMYLNGNGVRADANKASKYFRDGANKGSIDCVITMGDAYYDGGSQTPGSYVSAFEFYHIGVKQNNAYCIYRTADMLWDGLGVQRNHQLAVDYYEQAAMLGHVQSMFEIANCYHHGVEKPMDYEKAKYWYEKASENGNYGAMFAYAKWLNEEFNDFDKAIKYYELALQTAEAHNYFNIQAYVELGNLYKYRHNDFESARTMYDKCIEIFEAIRNTQSSFKVDDLNAYERAKNELENIGGTNNGIVWK